MRGKAAWSAEDARGDEVEEEEEAGEGEEGLEGQDRGEGEHGIGGGCWTVVVGGDAGGGVHAEIRSSWPVWQDRGSDDGLWCRNFGPRGFVLE